MSVKEKEKGGEEKRLSELLMCFSAVSDFEHSVSLVNTSKTITVRHVNLVIRQPKVCGGPCMIEIASPEWLDDNDSTTELRRIEPLERKQIKFRIFGIDPSAMAEDGSQKERDSETEISTCDAPSIEEAHDRIPFTGVCGDLLD
ncbi:unnamed protein product [Brugia timori]|uniref:PIH1_CS domain-containing protein n=1 Tax=Brugia timori TaxID=42155 RepID=A0A0R3QG32_9BILA|nr:unnamed protein product [Brugia timori]